jgi:ectoine hydroxylase-related dioxygenase (phytanoyl-CoA dioxygenase family)
LNFPVGTQQNLHSDSVHFSAIPERFMCGVWVALEDADEGNGALRYVPSSHKWPVYANEHIGHFTNDYRRTGQEVYEPLWAELMRVHGVEEQPFRAKKGDALIWSANLLHGGGASP